MNASTRVFTAIASIAFPVGALTASSTQAQESGRAPDHESRLISAIQGLAEPDLKATYLGCSRDALLGTLDWDEIAACSVVYETLLTREFGGDFFALLAWSKSRSTDPAEIALGGVHPVERR